MAKKTTETGTTETTTPKKKAEFKRKYRGTQILDHDLFKLEVAIMKRNISWNKKPRWVDVEHVHFFHTIDSSGRTQTTSNKVGGHYHLVQVQKNPDGSLVVDEDGTPIVNVGPAIQDVQVRDPETGEVRLEARTLPQDSHTHEASYRGSEKISPRKINKEAIKVETDILNRFNQRVEGVS